ncbi:hypothetical protein GCM10018782_10070 [Streptomyces griseoaurantiacus]|nr:hypothetical protein GCM10018782_10070 [Streptomyces griseoaurantiacus]
MKASRPRAPTQGFGVSPWNRLEKAPIPISSQGSRVNPVGGGPGLSGSRPLLRVARYSARVCFHSDRQAARADRHARHWQEMLRVHPGAPPRTGADAGRAAPVSAVVLVPSEVVMIRR